jgi:hypothetical protein
VIQLGSINLPAEDSGLTSRLDQFNAATAEHWEKMQSGTVDLEESELMQVSIDDLHDLAAGQFAAGLSLRQQTVKLTDLRAELLKDLSPELDRSLVEAEREESDTIKRTRKALIKAGHGPDAQPAGRFGNTVAAARQFDHLVMTSQPVQESRLKVNQCRTARDQHLKELRKTQELRVSAIAELRLFVTKALENKGF